MSNLESKRYASVWQGRDVKLCIEALENIGYLCMDMRLGLDK